MMTDLFGAAWAITAVSALTFGFGALVAVVMNGRARPAL
jgi:hypothetical protein